MIAVYQLFKIILGIIMSVFVLSFLIFFSGIYAGLQENTFKGKVITNFRTLSEDVYSTGIYQNFSDFSRKEFDMRFDTLTPPPGITYSSKDAINKIRIRVPTLFTPGEEVLVSRSSIKLGWWKFDFVEAIPRMTIAFDARDRSPESQELIENTVRLFQDTTFEKIKIMFAFCTGNNFVVDPATRSSFLNYLDVNGIPSAAPCNKPISRNQRIVTVSSSCSSFPGDVCLRKPAAGVGTAKVKNSNSNMAYMKNYPYSAVALIIGGSEENIEGVAGEILYNYINEQFFRELELASRVLGKKSDLVSTRINELNALDPFPPGSEILDCAGTLHPDFEIKMASLNGLVESMDYNSIGDMGNLVTKLDDAIIAHRALIDLACEYRIN